MISLSIEEDEMSKNAILKCDHYIKIVYCFVRITYIFSLNGTE